MIQGLHHELATKIARQDAANARLTDPDISANEKHSLNWTAGDLEREIDRIEEQIGQDEDMANAIGQFINFLNESNHKSRLRSLAIADLEQAQDRLRRELGDKPSA